MYGNVQGGPDDDFDGALDQMEGMIGSLKHQTLDINSTIRAQNDDLKRVDERMERNRDKMQRNKKDLDGIAHQNSWFSKGIM